MVNNHGQLYTIEGVAAAFLMIFTTYIVLSTTTIYTPADTHVIDMQLEQLGTDALAMMDTADTWGGGADPYYSELESLISEWKPDDFNSKYYQLINSRYDGLDPRPIHFTSKIYYRDSSDLIREYSFNPSGLLPGTRPVTVTRWVYITGDQLHTIWNHLDNPRSDKDQLVLLEVTLWRD